MTATRTRASLIPVLHVEDDPASARGIDDIAPQEGLGLELVEDIAEAMTRFLSTEYSCVIVDLEVLWNGVRRQDAGLELISRLRSGDLGEHGRTVPIIVHTAHVLLTNQLQLASDPNLTVVRKPALPLDEVKAVMKPKHRDRVLVELLPMSEDDEPAHISAIVPGWREDPFPFHMARVPPSVLPQLADGTDPVYCEGYADLDAVELTELALEIVRAVEQDGAVVS